MIWKNYKNIGSIIKLVYFSFTILMILQLPIELDRDHEEAPVQLQVVRRFGEEV